jgi:SPP1 family predicted phage head-tail adaptor
MKVCIGEMKHIVQIYRLVKTPDGMGGFTSSKEFVREVWAKVKPVSSHERLLAEQAKQIITHKIYISWSDDWKEFGANNDELTKTLLLEYNGREFRIQSVTNVDESNWVLELTCAEVAKAGG